MPALAPLSFSSNKASARWGMSPYPKMENLLLLLAAKPLGRSFRFLAHKGCSRVSSGLGLPQVTAVSLWSTNNSTLAWLTKDPPDHSLQRISVC